MAQYRSKNAVVDAIQFTGDNWEDFTDFIDIPYVTDTKEQHLIVPIIAYAKSGDWVVRNADQKLQVYTQEEFEQAYEPE